MAKAVNHKFFDNWSEETAWLLGFFAADGCVKTSRGTHVVSFKQANRRVVQAIKNMLKSKHKIIVQKDNHKPRYELSYTSEHTYQRLCEIFDMDVCAKSLTLKFPKCLPEDMARHFLRGCVDGDGSLFWHNTGVPYLKFTSGSEEFSTGFFDSVYMQTGIKAYKEQGRVFNSVYSGIKAKLFAEWLYEDCSICLERKKNMAKDFSEWQPRHVWAKSITPKMRLVFSGILP